jgi:hypothetical protein
MISCLVCASSILVVAGAFARQHPVKDIDVTTLDEDAETCLAVFEALSHNSSGAKLARDMMSKLREQCLGSAERLPALPTRGSVPMPNATVPAGPCLDITDLAPYLTDQMLPTTSFAEQRDLSGGQGLNSRQNIPYYQQMDDGWPADISDAMAWSAQMFDFFQGQPDVTQQDSLELSDPSTCYQVLLECECLEGWNICRYIINLKGNRGKIF